MSTIIDNILLNIFIKIYELKTTNYINNNIQNMNIIFDNEHITDKLIDIFYKKANSYFSTIIENALTYSIYFKEEDFINKIKNLKKEINNLNNLDNKFKRELLYNCIKLILLKQNHYIKKHEIILCRENNIEIYSYINNTIQINIINTIYKNIVFMIIKNQNIELDKNSLKDIIHSKKYDELIKKYSMNTINNEKEINQFKMLFSRLFLCDVYIYEIYFKHKVIDETNYMPKEISHFLLKNVTEPILDYINKCIYHNIFYIPFDLEIINEMINGFITFNTQTNTKEVDNIKTKYNKTLKKIYPMYILDKIG